MIQLPAVFSDGLVLQAGWREHPKTPVWGQATPGSQITLSFQGQTGTAQATEDGRWRIDLDLLKPDPNPSTMQISGDSSEVIIQDIVVGEVWICSGQSNMTIRLNNCEGGKDTCRAANFPLLRFFPVAQRGAKEVPFSVEGQWYKSVSRMCRLSSAVAFAFGRHLIQHLDYPVGLLQSTVGGTPAECWMRYYPGCPIVQMPLYNLRKAMNDPEFILENQDLYRGMVQPLQPYAARGVVWYQGEANEGRAWEYRDILPRLIAEWRKDFEQNLPFIVVQLAPRGSRRIKPLCVARESQLVVCRTVPDTYLVVIDDVGAKKDVHPPKKLVIGDRAGLVARGAVYWHPVEYRSAECVGVRQNEGHLLLRFEPVGEGLVTRDGADAVRGFTVAGRGERFIPAKARIVARNIVWVGRPRAVREPVAARYGYVSWSEGNLNANGLPVSPFRTDDFRVPTQPEEGCAV